ncbi:MAG: DNA alkylation repair protein [Syntrophomonadaceae bacterium]
MVSRFPILEEFRQNGNPVNAVPMAKYMRSQFAFLGIPRTKRDQLQKGFLQAARRQGIIDWDFVRQCWDLPEREYQYLGVDYLAVLCQKLQPPDMQRLEILIVSKSWWDTVDLIAARLVGGLYARHPHELCNTILQWSEGDSLWLRRSAIIFQLKYKHKTDTDLLGRIITRNCSSQEFFIDKAIGWALREYSKTDPAWVRDFMASHDLSRLSRREGSKYLNKSI